MARHSLGREAVSGHVTMLHTDVWRGLVHLHDTGPCPGHRLSTNWMSPPTPRGQGQLPEGSSPGPGQQERPASCSSPPSGVMSRAGPSFLTLEALLVQVLCWQGGENPDSAPKALPRYPVPPQRLADLRSRLSSGI